MAQDMKCRAIFQIALTFAFVIFTHCLHAQKPDDTIGTIARNELQSYLQRIQPGTEKKYGFKTRDEFISAVVGSPIQVFTIHPDSIREIVKPGKSYFVALEEWKVPVKVGGELRALLTVASVGGTLKVVELGGAELAHELSAVEGKHPGDKKSLLRLYQLHCDFLVLTHGEKNVSEGDLYPLSSAAIAFPEQRFDKDVSRSAQRLLPVLRQKYIDRLRSGVQRNK